MEKAVGFNVSVYGWLWVYAEGSYHNRAAASFAAESVGVQVGDAHYAVKVVDMFQLIGAKRQCQFLYIPTF